MKKKKFVIYLLSMTIPVAIFLICATINGYLPFGSEMLNSYDSFTQYPGMLLEYANLLRSGNLFYSWGAGLGFNFFSTLTYYGMSPLNLLALFANPQNYHMFIALMMLLRFALLGGSMCFYLEHKNLKPAYVVLFSIIYALMGYTSTYYYNYIWIDSVIMLPLVIHGLDKLIDEKSPAFYIASLTFTILINYYIGYMICIFCLIWFLYNLVNKKEKKKLLKTFIISSALAGLMGAIVILPSFFALLTGKAELYNSVKYLGVSRNALTFFYTLTSGAYQSSDQTNGPALVYCTIMTVVLSIFYFFNKKFSKKEKIASLAVIVLFYISFSFNLLNYAWQLFQKPIWWQSRFSFTFSFFLITLAVKTLPNIDKTEFKNKYRVLISILFIIACIVGVNAKWKFVPFQTYTFIYLGLSILVFLEMMFLLDKKGFMTMLIIFTLLELSLNTYNSLKNNYRYMSYINNYYIKEEVPIILDELNDKNEYFYRLEFMDDFTSDDGLYFGYNGINYFNSVRNVAPLESMESIGITLYDKCHIRLNEFDPVALSLLNVKYLYGQDMDYFMKVESRLYENPYPLSLGFMAGSSIKDLELGDDILQNKENILRSLTGLDETLYDKVDSSSFSIHEEESKTVASYSFSSKGHYLLMPEFSGTVVINDEEQLIPDYYVEIEEGDDVKINYNIYGNYDEEEIYFNLLNLDVYEKYMDSLDDEILYAKTNIEGHILKATITSSGKYDYLYTSIEYERGMKVYVDGQLTEPDIVMGALIGVPISNGEHEIIIDYVPNGFKPGAFLSLTGLVATVIYLQTRKKKI